MSTGLFGCWHTEQDSWNPHLEGSVFPWDVCASWNGKGTSFHSFSRLSQCRVPVYLWAPGCFPDSCIKLLFQERKHEMCSAWLWHLAGGSLFRRVQQIHTQNEGSHYPMASTSLSSFLDFLKAKKTQTLILGVSVRVAYFSKGL